MGSSLVNEIFLVQTDTTAGFLSQNREALALAKSRPTTKPFIKVFASLKSLHAQARVPNMLKREIRRSKKRTYVLNEAFAFRVIKDERHRSFVKKAGWFYSTSANASQESFSLEYAYKKSDIICENSDGLSESSASEIFKIEKNRKKRVR